ncbi:MAG: 4Fe-4S dicluster domain-containing protein, partial [Gammaproteobacteria bacterium]|nr:4Fe-4S dicluster domain-containing protein [Gammaproteobacteria bacterium]
MSSGINRIQFLRGGLSGKRDPIRPPWSLPEPEFIDKCNRCGDCIPACEYELIKIDRGGYPEIDFSQGGCDFCGDCVTVCKPGAIKKASDEDALPWTLKATILDSCLS